MNMKQPWKPALLALFLGSVGSVAPAQQPAVQPQVEASQAVIAETSALPMASQEPTPLPPLAQFQYSGSQGFDGGEGCYGTPGTDWMSATVVDGSTAQITVTLPEKAKLFVNGDPTASTGPVRYFVVRRLEAGEVFKFVFRAEMENAAGVKLEEKKEVLLKGGSMEAFALHPWQKVPEEKKEEGEAPAAEGPK